MTHSLSNNREGRWQASEPSGKSSFFLWNINTCNLFSCQRARSTDGSLTRSLAKGSRQEIAKRSRMDEKLKNSFAFTTGTVIEMRLYFFSLSALRRNSSFRVCASKLRIKIKAWCWMRVKQVGHKCVFHPDLTTSGDITVTITLSVSRLKQARLHHSPLLSKQTHPSNDNQCTRAFLMEHIDWLPAVYACCATPLALVFGQSKNGIGHGQQHITSKLTHIHTVFLLANPQSLSPCSLLIQKEAAQYSSKIKMAASVSEFTDENAIHQGPRCNRGTSLEFLQIWRAVWGRLENSL